MQRTVSRLAVAIVSGLALFVLSAAPALATTVTTEPASNRTTTSAVVHGLIDTGGEPTAWEFQWGRTTLYGQHTPLQQIPGGQGTVSVSATLTHLAPDTTYHFRLVATTGQGSVAYPLNVAFGNDVTFTTKATGTLLLLHSRLVITNKFVSVALRCLSGRSCTSPLTISTRPRLQNGKPSTNVLCATTFFTIGAHRTGTVRARVRNGCLALLRRSPQQSRHANLTSHPLTGQKGPMAKVVVLVLG